MQTLIIAVHVLVAIAIIVLVLLQHGKGADAGAAFGSGSANTMFGSVGSMSFFMKLTAILALIFFATSLALSYLASHQKNNNLQFLENISAPAPSQSPAAPNTMLPKPPEQPAK